MNDRPVLHASMSQQMVNRLVYTVAKAERTSFAAAKDKLAMRWALEARDRIRQNLSTYRMWEEMVDMAHAATLPPKDER